MVCGVVGLLLVPWVAILVSCSGQSATRGVLYTQLTESIGKAGEELQDTVRQASEDTKAEVEKVLEKYRKAARTLDLSTAQKAKMKADAETEVNKIMEDGRVMIRELMAQARTSVGSAFALQQERLKQIEDTTPPQAKKSRKMAVGEMAGKPKDAIKLCVKNGADGCAIMKHAEAPLSAHPYCACEPRIQQQETQRTQWLDFFYNKYSALRKCHGELCHACITTLTRVFDDLTTTSPSNEELWCRKNYGIADGTCLGMIGGFKLASEGIKFEVASEFDLMTDDMRESCARSEGCLRSKIYPALERSCKRLDCCTSMF